MKYILFSILFLSLSFGLFSQENLNGNTIQTSMKLRVLQEKKAEYHRRTNGESDGYRVKIHFGSDRTKAEEIQSKFSGKYSDIPTYQEYQQPNFVIMVGDYKTKLEAFEVMKKIKEDFPYAFIVKSKVRPIKIN